MFIKKKIPSRSVRLIAKRSHIRFSFLEEKEKKDPEYLPLGHPSPAQVAGPHVHAVSTFLPFTPWNTAAAFLLLLLFAAGGIHLASLGSSEGRLPAGLFVVTQISRWAPPRG